MDRIDDDLISAERFKKPYWEWIAGGRERAAERIAERSWMSRCTARRQLLCGPSDLALAAGWPL
jgi:hypothetical protein